MNGKPRVTSSMNHWKVCTAFRSPKGIRANSKNPKRHSDGCLMDVSRLHWYLMLCLNQVDLGEKRSSFQRGYKILQMGNWVAVGYGAFVERPVVSTRAPVSRCTMCSGEDQLLHEGCITCIPNSSMWSHLALATWSRSGASRRGQAATGGPVVVIWWVILLRAAVCVYTGCVIPGYSRRRVS